MAGMPYPPNKRGAVETTAPPGDSGGIQTHDLQNRNLTLYSAKLRDPLSDARFSGCMTSKRKSTAKLLLLFEITKYLGQIFSYI